MASVQTAANATLAVVDTFTASGGTGTGFNAGSILVGGDADLVLGGSVGNYGKIDLTSVGHVSFLQIEADTSLSGGGSVILSGNSTATSITASVSSMLTNVDNTISGVGYIGDRSQNLLLVNDAKGVIDATGSNSLILQTESAPLVNRGLIEATGSGGLLIANTVVDNKGGTIFAGNGSGVFLHGTVEGGTLASVGTGVFHGYSVITLLDGTTSALTNTGRVEVGDGNRLNIEGSIVNSGTIAVNSVTAGTRLRILSAGVTLSGGGTVGLGGPTAEVVSFPLNPATTLTNVDNTISGVGYLGLKELTLVNDAKGVIDANAPGYLLVNTAAATLTNAGLLTAGDGGVLVLASQTIDQTGGGTIAAQAGGRVNLQGVDVIGGTVSAPGGGVVSPRRPGGHWTEP